MTDLLDRARGALHAQPFSVLLGTELMYVGENELTLCLLIRDEFRQRLWELNNSLLSPENLSALGLSHAAAFAADIVRHPKMTDRLSRQDFDVVSLMKERILSCRSYDLGKRLWNSCNSTWHSERGARSTPDFGPPCAGWPPRPITPPTPRLTPSLMPVELASTSLGSRRFPARGLG